MNCKGLTGDKAVDRDDKQVRIHCSGPHMVRLRLCMFFFFFLLIHKHNNKVLKILKY